MRKPTRENQDKTALHTSVLGMSDSRNDLGYGRLSSKFQNPRLAASTYPYKETDFLEDKDDGQIDDQTMSAVKSKSHAYYANDFFSAGKADPFYFAGGNSKLTDCFWRPDSVLQEIAAFGDSMTPIPQLYKGRGPAFSGASSVGPNQSGSNYRRTGSFRGWASPPPRVELFDEDERSGQEDFYTLEDLAKNSDKNSQFS